MSPTPQKLEARIRRYLRVRAADRAVAFATRFRDSIDAGRCARRAAEALRGELRHRGGDAPALDLSALDACLEDYGAAVQAVVSATPLAQFRATIAAALELQRAEVGAFLDFCLQDANTALARIDLVDFLVTALCTSTQNGMRQVVRDPTRLTRRLTAVSEAVAGQLGAEADAAAARLREATGRLADLEDVADQVAEMRALKQALGRAFFAPEVLRAMVAWNVAVANHFQTLLDAERQADKDLLVVLSARPR
jgi:hypothetical protein